MKKILFVESASEMGGVEFSALYLAAHLDKTKWRPVILCPREGRFSAACREANLEVRISPAPKTLPTSFRINGADARLPNPLAWLWNPIPLAAAAWTLKKTLQAEKPDLILTHGLQAHFFGGLAARLSNLRCVWHVQDFVSERFFGLYRAFFGLCASLLADEVVADGSPIAKQLPKKIQKRVFVVLNGVDTEVFAPNLRQAGANLRATWGLGAEHVVIGHAARITPWKGQLHLLEAFALLEKRHPEARLVFIGAALFDNDDYEKRLKARTAELGLQNKVIFAGFRSDLAEVLNALDIFAYPSAEKDTSPLALLSALACGLPVVAFNIEGVREVLEGAGKIVPVRDETKMAQALEELISDPSLRKRMQAQSRARALARFSLEKYVESMESVFLRKK